MKSRQEIICLATNLGYDNIFKRQLLVFPLSSLPRIAWIAVYTICKITKSQMISSFLRALHSITLWTMYSMTPGRTKTLFVRSTNLLWKWLLCSADTLDLQLKMSSPSRLGMIYACRFPQSERLDISPVYVVYFQASY